MATTTTAASNSIDVASLVSQLMAVERQPITKLNTKTTSYQAKISALGLIKSNVASFLTAVQALGSSSSSSLLAFKATPSDATVLSASASSTAVAGSYSINVTTLARAQNLAAAGQTLDTDPIGTVASTATFTIGATSTDISIAAGATLQDIRTAINAANIGVTATIVNDGSGSPYRLAISSNNTGLSNSVSSITVKLGGDDAINSLLSYNPTENTPVPAPAVPMAQTVAAVNAVFTVNGIQITKASNIVTDAIEGVTLTLSKEATPATLTVARDTAAVSDKVAGFVKAYNDLYSALKNSTAYKSKSALEGDATLRSFMTEMRSIAGAAVSGGTLTNMYQVGLTFKADGTMQLDSAALSSAMGTNFNDVANLFNSATGYATAFASWATSANAIGGTIDTKTAGFNTSITNIATQISTLEARMTQLQKQYTTTYSNLNVLLSSMGKTSAYLAQQLG